MSDFIGRVAARAVGERAAASPRVPSLFEAPGAAPGAAPEVIDEEVVAPAPTRASPGAPAAPSQPGASPGPAAAPVPAPRPGETAAMRVEADALPPAEQGTEASPRETGGRTPEGVATTPAPAPPRTQAEERSPAVAAISAPVLTPALPAVARVPAHAVPMPAATPAEPPAVRVHIGRLEVRANLQNEQPRRPERPPVPRTQELSLSDYLRGRRESR